MKTCSKCGIFKPFNEFHWNGDRYRAMCKLCRASHRRVRGEHADYYARNKTAVDVKSSEWAATNKDRRKATNRALYERDGDRIRARNKSYHAADPARRREQLNAWRAANPEKSRAKVARRRANRKRATPAWANEEKIREYYALADLVSKATGTPYHVDHIVPLQSAIVCGLHWEGNLQILEGSENIRKRNLYWPDMPC